jgi:hypothetical protein
MTLLFFNTYAFRQQMERQRDSELNGANIPEIYFYLNFFMIEILICYSRFYIFDFGAIKRIFQLFLCHEFILLFFFRERERDKSVD